MEMNVKIKFTVAMLVLILFFTCNVDSMGMSPPQLRITNTPISGDTKMATLVLRNTDDESAYILMQITCLASSRSHKLRVVCNNCSRETGIQRGDLLDGTCPFCSSGNLLFYDFPPAFVLDGISLKCEKEPLEKIGDKLYKTIDKVNPKDAIEVDIYLDLSSDEMEASYLNDVLEGAVAPLTVKEVGRVLNGRANASIYFDYIEKCYGQHWEARITATSVSNISETGGGTDFVAGLESKVLIDTIGLQLKTQAAKSADDFNFILWGIGGLIAGVFIVVAAAIYRNKNKEIVKGTGVKVEEKVKKHKKVSGGRKIL